MKKILLLFTFIAIFVFNDSYAQKIQDPRVDHHADSCYINPADSLPVFVSWELPVPPTQIDVDFFSADTVTSDYFTDTMRIYAITSLGDTLPNIDFQIWVGGSSRFENSNWLLINKTDKVSVSITRTNIKRLFIKWENVAEYLDRKVKIGIRTLLLP